MGTNWIPPRRSSFVALCFKWGEILSNEQKVTAFRWIAEMVAALLKLLKDFVDAEKAYTAADTTENHHAMLKARQELEKAMKEFARTSIRNNPGMTEADREAMGIFAPDTTPTTHPAPDAVPYVEVETTPYHYQHRVRVFCAGVRKGSKPAGVYGVRIVWQVGGAKPATGADIIKGKFGRKPEMTAKYTEAEEGQIAYYAACYENAKGEAGSWSKVVQAVIG